MLRRTHIASRWLVAIVAFLLSAAPAQATYWSVFNIEGEATQPAHYVTYATLADMLTDTNRTGDYAMLSFGRNIVGSGSDGTTYWSVFNIEGEATQPAHYVIYATLADMLADTNRTGDYAMLSFGRNIVGSGADILTAPPPPPPSAIPEPATLALLVFGLVAIGVARRRGDRLEA